MIYVVKCHFEVIFCFLTNRKCDFFQVDKAAIQVAECVLKDLSSSWQAQNFSLMRLRNRCFKWTPGTGNLFSSSRPAQNATWVKSRKRCFKDSHATLNSFSATWTAQNATWLRSRKRCFKGSHVTLNSFSASWPTQNATWVRMKNDVSDRKSVV